ncbi:hypothetical protein CNBG_1226 [Cryptococcus deuterogattii R265]|uniref:uncharacterized protein n=1 Tax=Cryptococcus deuterogattii (strain R265) TaxID=294750 RepID=UPI0019363574|nr:hypothetical protein CNBG_1226 [Cryptococcus deuterogattii R265]
MALLFSRKVLFGGIFTLSFLAILTHLGVTGNYKVHSGAARFGFLPSSWTAERSPYVPADEYPETEYIMGVAGFNYFRNLYFSNGTFLALTTRPSSFPEQGVDFIFSGIVKEGDPYRKHFAADEDRFAIMTPKEAMDSGLLQPAAIRKEGISMFFNDVREGRWGSFLDHYFHFIGEMFLGCWRLTVAAGEHEFPTRIMYRAEGIDWRDHARITTWFQQSILPDTVIEESSIYEDRALSQMTFIYDRIAIADRWAAHRVGQEVKFWNKATADLPLLKVPSTWMDPMRNRLKALAMAEDCNPQRERAGVPVVVYINRQLTKRRLVDEDAKALLEQMAKLDKEGVIEFHNAQMEKLPRVQQFCLALRADIMFGVHGNGLSHQLWMKPGSGVLEIMAEGFARDYAILAEMMGHEYHTIHYNKTFPPDQWRRPDGWAVDQGPDFHSANIRLDAEWFASLITDMAQRRIYVTEPELSLSF